MTKIWAALLVVGMVGCASKDDGKPTLEGTWVYTGASGTTAAGLTFESDGRYVAQLLHLTSETSAEVVAETGTYTSTGSAVTFTPEQSTCPDEKGDVYTYSYSLPSSTSLDLVTPDGMLAMQRSDGSRSSNFAIQFGCVRNGVFTKSPLAPIAK